MSKIEELGKKIGSELIGQEPKTKEVIQQPIEPKKELIGADAVTEEVIGQDKIDVGTESGIQEIEPPVQPEPIETPKAEDFEQPEIKTAPQGTAEPKLQTVNIDDYAPDITPKSGRIDEIINNGPSLATKAEAIQSDLIIDPDYMMDDPIHINPNTFEGQDIVQTLAKVAQQNRPSIMAQRRGDESGVLSDKELNSLASDLGLRGNEQIDMWKKRLPGEAANAETVMLMKSYLTQSALKLKKLAKNVAGNEDASPSEKIEFSKAYAEHIEVYDSFMGVRAEAGRAMRAFGLKTEVDMSFTDTLAHIEAGMDINRIAETINNTSTVGGVSQAIEATRPGAIQRIGNALHEVWINSILSGIKTQIVNTTGGALQIGMHRVDLAVGALMGRNPFNKEMPNEADYIAVDEVLGAGFAQISVLQEAMHAAMKVAKTGEQYSGMTGTAGGSKLEVQTEAISSKAFGFDEASPLGRAADMMGTVIRVPTERVMGGVDGFMRVLGEHQSIYEQAFRMARQAERSGDKTADEAKAYLQDLIENPTPQMMDVAVEFSKRAVFQTDTSFTRKASAFFQELPAGRWIVPFIRTPMNLVTQAFLERSPLGLINANIRADLIAGGARGQLARSRLATGTALAVSFYSMAYNGQITGSEPQDKATRDAWRLAGVKARSFKFDNSDGTVSYVSYDRLEPFSFIFGAAADIAAMQKDVIQRADYREEALETDKMITSIILGLTNNVLDKTFMVGLQDAMTALTRGGESFERWARNYVASTVPFSGLRRDLTKFNDDTIRISETVSEDIAKNMLAMSENLPERLDIFGNGVRYDHILGIWKEQYKTTNKVKLEVLRITESIGQIPITQIGRTVGGVRLKASKHNELIQESRTRVTIAGRTFYEAIEYTINSYTYSKMTDEARRNYIKSIQRKYDDIARRNFLEDNIEIAEQVEKLKMIKRGERNGI